MEFGEYGMFSVAGGKRVGTLVKRLKKAAETHSRAVIVQKLKAGMTSIAKRYPEVHDTDVREQIASALDNTFEQAGLDCLSYI